MTQGQGGVGMRLICHDLWPPRFPSVGQIVHRLPLCCLSTPSQAALLPPASLVRFSFRKEWENAPVPSQRREYSMGFTVGLWRRTRPTGSSTSDSSSPALQTARKALNKTHQTQYCKSLFSGDHRKYQKWFSCLMGESKPVTTTIKNKPWQQRPALAIWG